MSTPLLAAEADLALYGLSAPVLAGFTSEVKTAQLRAASGRVWSYIANRYPNGLASPGETIVQAVCALASAELLQVRGWSPSNEDDRTIMARAETTLTWLRDVGRGHASIPDATPAPEVQHRVSSGADVLSADLRGW